MSNIFIGLKKTCLGVLDTAEPGNGNETSLKEGEGIEMSTTMLSIYAIARSPFAFVFTYLRHMLCLQHRYILVKKEMPYLFFEGQGPERNLRPRNRHVPIPWQPKQVTRQPHHR